MSYIRKSETQHINRRRFLTYAGAATVAVGAVSCSNGESSSPAAPSSAEDGSSPVPFRGPHQPALLAPPAAAGLVAGLDVTARNRAELGDTFALLSDTIENLMTGATTDERDGGFPAHDSGILGPDPGTTPVGVLVGVGSSLFDDRFGLASRMPLELQPMPKFANDYLVQPEQSHGDLSITIHGPTQQATVHAFRQILRQSRGLLVPRWSKDGFNNLLPDRQPGQAPARNLMGFRDGTVNPDLDDADEMHRVVWTQSRDDQPEWAVGGTYQAVRVIRMMVEFWDRTRLNEQEAIFHRRRDSGAPLGLKDETDVPRFGDDEALASHIGRANPRTPGTERNHMLRRGAFNYTDGIDQNDQLDQGLVFISYQRSLKDGFIAVQRRLDGEALEEYVRPIGGGFFFVLPGPAPGEHLGAALLG